MTKKKIEYWVIPPKKSGWREVRVRTRKTKIDWAEEVAYILDTFYSENKRVTLVCDNLNTHTPGSFYEVFNAP